MHLSNIKFAFALCVVLTGCTEITFITNEAPTGLPPVSADDASAAVADAGVMATTDAGLPGSDAFIPPMDDAAMPDAGTDSAVVVEADAGSDAGVTDIDAGPGGCEAVDVPTDGSGQVIVRVEGGGDMTVPPDTDFVAFSVIVENHMSASVSGEVTLHSSTLSADCTVRGPDASFRNVCDELNGFRPGFCGAGSCGVSCGEIGPMFASGTSTRFTMFGHTRASGTFQIDMGLGFGGYGWIVFRNTAGIPLPTTLVVGDEPPSPLVTITVP